MWYYGCKWKYWIWEDQPSMDCHTVSKSLGQRTSISPNWLSSCTNYSSFLNTSFRISTVVVVSFRFRNQGFTSSASDFPPSPYYTPCSRAPISNPFSPSTFMLPDCQDAGSAVTSLRSESSSSIETLVFCATWVSRRSLLTLLRYSSKDMSCSSVSSSIELMKVSFSFARSPLSTSFSALLMLISFLRSFWFLITWAEVSPITLVYSFHSLKMLVRSRAFCLKTATLASGVATRDSIYCSLVWERNSSLARRSLSCSSPSCLLALRRSISKLCLCTSCCVSSRLQLVMAVLNCKQRGISNLFFSFRISSLLVSRWSSSKFPNSQASASANSLQQYSVEAMYSGKMVSSLSLVSTFSLLNQQLLLSCSMILRMRLRLIFLTSQSCRCLLSFPENSSSLALQRTWFSWRRKALVKTCLRKVH